jgi:site-specific recombinase XerD
MDEQLNAFRRWMIGRGRSEGTAEQYFWCVRKCLEHKDGPIGRLVGRKLAPKTKRINKAALRAWAKFTSDADLLLLLEDLRLPPPERVTVKEPLTNKEWAAMSDAIDTINLDEVSRAVLTMICERGFRVSDVLRLEQSQVRRGIETGVLLYTGKGDRQQDCLTDSFQWCLKSFIDAGKRLKNWDHVWTLMSPRAKNPPRAARLKIQRYVKQVATEAGIDPDEIYTHRLRRTIATEFYNETKDIVALQKYMGWADIKTASNYVDHSEREELEKVAARIRKRRQKK